MLRCHYEPRGCTVRSGRQRIYDSRHKGTDQGSALTNAVIAGITSAVAPSISQCPEPLTTLPVTLVATSLVCSMRKVPEAFSPAITRNGISRRGAAATAETFATLSKVRETP